MISIVMPVKNAFKYLEECILSIQNQSLADWELIAINDNSSDDSIHILNKFSDSDSRIKVFNNDGKGIIDALILAYSKTEGEFISRMDADDKMHPNKLQMLSDSLRENPKAIITAKVSYFSDTELGQGYLDYQNWLNQFIDQQNHYSGIYQECVLPSPCWMMTRSTLDALGGFKSLSYPEDYDLCFKAYQKNIQILGVNEILHYWRDYSERTSRNDPNYADNTFIGLKTRYFIACDNKSDQPLILWGAGKKGKKIARLLIESGTKFIWATNNPKKLNVPIYDQQLVLDEEISDIKDAQLIIAIADRKASEGILRVLQASAVDEVYYFC
jgi:glycosyltransferase involved in cell wall biosynthesis